MSTVHSPRAELLLFRIHKLVLVKCRLKLNRNQLQLLKVRIVVDDRPHEHPLAADI